MKSIAVLLFLFLSSNACPRQEDLKPCSCVWRDMEDSADITCAKLVNNQELTSSAQSLIGINNIDSVKIFNSAFSFIPSNTFKGAKFTELHIKDSTLMSLTDTDVAFEGLENYLRILRLDNCILLNHWDFSIFRKLKKLITLDIERGALESIEDMGKINLATLNTVSFSYNQIDFIHDYAFFKNKELMMIALDNNKISTLKRTMFPNPAIKLMDMNLNNNEIEQLPDDIFTNMPKLVNLNIGGNKILVISERVFSPIWGKLESFVAMRNDLRCDCRMTWILHTRMPRRVRASCANPQALKGKSLVDLTSKDLWCIY